MTGTGAPRSPEQEQSADAVQGAPEDGGQPSQSPAMVRAAKLNAANMVRSLLPLVLICMVLVGWAALRQNPDDPVLEVDPSTSVRTSAERAGYELLVPTGLPDAYRPTSARTSAGDATEGEPVTLEIGYLTPEEEFAGFVISDDPDAEPLGRVLDDATEQGTASIGDRTWTRQSTADGETALVLDTGDATVLVFGSAPDEELTEVAASVSPYRG
jgi:Protein of unknown function (DUF4245)